MNTPTKDDQNPSFLWNQVLTPPSRSTSPTAPMSTPTLSLWSRKLSLQSEELNTLLQKSTTKLHEHQQDLTDLLKTCKVDLSNTKHELEAIAKKRDDEFDTQLAALRRITQTTTDLLYALEAKLSLLGTLNTVHHKLQSHDLQLCDLQQGQKQLLVEQKKLVSLQERMLAGQEGLGATLRSITRVLGEMQKVHVHAAAEVEEEVQETPEEGAIAREVPLTMQLKRPRRLMSDEELLAEEAMFQREPSMELMLVEEVRQVRERTETIEKAAVTADNGGGFGVLERPLKRKLLSTMDVEQFADEFMG